MRKAFSCYTHHCWGVGDEKAAEESALAADEFGLITLSNPGAGMAARFPRIMGYYAYQEPSQAIIAEAPSPSLHSLGLDGRPGTRAPHAWIERQNQRISTLDLFGTQFVLLTGGEGEAWCSAAQAVAVRLNIPLVAYRLAPDGDLVDAEKRWPEKAGIEASGALLIRPDGFVAWRSQHLSSDPASVLEQILTHLLCRA